MHELKTIGVIGQGFVGGAIARAFRQLEHVDVLTYDKFRQDLSSTSLDALVSAADVIFVCVPTPALRDGRCDTSIVESVIDDIDGHLQSSNVRRDFKPIVVIKSTVPPGTTDALWGKAQRNIDIVFSPEFLNARTAFEDFINQDHVVLGGDLDVCYRLTPLFEELLPNANIVIVPARVAETAKYVKNCFFATKVSFFNEMYQVCAKLDVDYESVIDIIRYDARIGNEHMRVPGPTPAPDGTRKFGFGGVCLPKDLRAFISIARQLGVEPCVMEAAWKKNLEVRPERDWELLSGAVTKND